jgi:cytochrome oxidase assembly protein ShyY1
MILSSTAFVINLGLSLWQIRRLAGQTKEVRSASQIKLQPDLDTNELVQLSLKGWPLSPSKEM